MDRPEAGSKTCGFVLVCPPPAVIGRIFNAGQKSRIPRDHQQRAPRRTSLAYGILSSSPQILSQRKVPKPRFIGGLDDIPWNCLCRARCSSVSAKLNIINFLIVIRFFESRRPRQTISWPSLYFLSNHQPCPRAESRPCSHQARGSPSPANGANSLRPQRSQPMAGFLRFSDP